MKVYLREKTIQQIKWKIGHDIFRGKSVTTKKAVVQISEGDTIDFYNKL